MDTQERTPAVDFNALYKTRLAEVRQALRRLGVHEKDVPDAAQEVFAVVHRRARAFEGRSSVRTWLHGICRCVAADYRRRAANRHEVFGVRVEPTASAEEAVEGALQGQQAQATVREAMKVLSQPERRVVELFIFEAMSMVEVARALCCPPQTAYARLYAAKARLREVLAPLRFAL